MKKTTWALFASIVVTAAGSGAYYLIWRQTAEQASPFPSDPVPQFADGGLTRRKLEGIGSTRDLKPTPIPQSNAR
ncbi:hypothetical protein [Variovorax sp. YR266]|uniref:hypothetical protein n=1 Tax=Variovorax sp. YR266 TaxID=1884386 RepID=UPI00115FEA43|nr:hypothetical protein [Variovorax sp. YR266]